MTQTVVTADRVTAIEAASAQGEDLWLPLADLTAATGWELKPEGACRDDVCIPIPPGREAEFTRPGRFNLAALARHLDQPIIRHQPSDSWVIGESAAGRSNLLHSLQAPDFTLPDLDGKLHTLSDYRGKKVFLASWASW